MARWRPSPWGLTARVSLFQCSRAVLAGACLSDYTGKPTLVEILLWPTAALRLTPALVGGWAAGPVFVNGLVFFALNLLAQHADQVVSVSFEPGRYRATSVDRPRLPNEPVTKRYPRQSAPPRWLTKASSCALSHCKPGRYRRERTCAKCCALGYGPIAACHSRSCLCMSGSLSSCTTLFVF